MAVDVARHVLRAFAASPPDGRDLSRALSKARRMQILEATHLAPTSVGLLLALARVVAQLENQLALTARDATSAAALTALCARLNAFDAAARSCARDPASTPADRARAEAAVERQARALRWGAGVGDGRRELMRWLRDYGPKAGDACAAIVGDALELLIRQGRHPPLPAGGPAATAAANVTPPSVADLRRSSRAGRW